MDFKEYFRHKSLRKIANEGVHFEQKTTPDLLWCVALVVLDITKDDATLIFSDRDVRESPVFNDLMQDYFTKPPQAEAEDEYNKVSSYQLDLFVFAGLLEQVSSRPKSYRIANRDALQDIAVRDLDAAVFLTEYTEKFLRDNGLLHAMEVYRQTPTQDNYQAAKHAYWNWAKINTAVRTNNPQHSFRVFNKIFNIYCYKHRIPGELRSTVTEGPCAYSFLVYNRDNFRDSDMPRGITRREYQSQYLSKVNADGVTATQVSKAKAAVSDKYRGSEITAPEYGYSPGRIIHVHHIMPQHSFKEFSASRENLIALTPDQHLSFAHNQGTRTISKHYQAICLKIKLDHIVESLARGEDFYDYARFVRMININYGLSLNECTPPERLDSILDDKIHEFRD